jgi:hypothetical protein
MGRWPLAYQPCPCENSHCPHHKVGTGDEPFEPCPNRAEGDVIGKDPIMMFLGPCCRPCAEAMAAEYPQGVMVPIGTATVYEG